MAKFDPRTATSEQVTQLYMNYLGVVSCIGNEAPRLIHSNPENEEIIEQVFSDCEKLTGIKYKRTIDRFELKLKDPKPKQKFERMVELEFEEMINCGNMESFNNLIEEKINSDDKGYVLSAISYRVTGTTKSGLVEMLVTGDMVKI